MCEDEVEEWVLGDYPGCDVPGCGNLDISLHHP